MALNDETVALLRAHKAHQAAVKMANRTTYRDLGLVFAKELPDVTGKHATLGTPLSPDGINRRELQHLIEAAGVKRITFHGSRHCVVSWLLANGEPVHAVARRVGHANATTTMNVYAHVMPDADEGKAQRLGATLYGR